ncbi:MAG: DDE-type integrase/transposase/recombinase [Nitrospira sp.]|nr:DDE-type integrase/transposase/recombinase [Nitrospira sp.]
MATLMHRMGMAARYRKPHLCWRHPAHTIYPYLLRDPTIHRPNHVWAADITYIPMRRGFVYLFAVLDWASRLVLAWRLSNTLTTDFCLESVREAITQYGCPRNLQHRPRVSVHQSGVHGTLERLGDSDQHARQKMLARQRIRGTVMAKPQIRGGLPARL